MQQFDLAQLRQEEQKLGIEVLKRLLAEFVTLRCWQDNGSGVGLRFLGWLTPLRDDIAEEVGLISPIKPEVKSVGVNLWAFETVNTDLKPIPFSPM